MIAAARGHMKRAEDLLVPNVPAAGRKLLCAKAWFAQFSSHWVGCKFDVVRFDSGRIAFQQPCMGE
jgi:hypothetical protein